ncbi:hypothetical protein T484DRAFT_3585932 [Baffinella frigidus]|nr:hypothetical protein T484DRAFT_3585932 [Cryptophyta sp. CCMP2293]
MTERDTRRCGAINKVTMQSNGNLVVWGTRDWCWHANTNYHGFTPQMVLTMQSDGNLVMYDRRGRVNPTNPTPYTLHPTPYTLHPAPCNLHPTPYTLHPTPYTLHPTP